MLHSNVINEYLKEHWNDVATYVDISDIQITFRIVRIFPDNFPQIIRSNTPVRSNGRESKTIQIPDNNLAYLK
jgi:hypothetical protein